MRDFAIFDANSPPPIHPAEQPPAENVAMAVGVGRHRQRTDAKTAAGLRLRAQWWVNAGVGHAFLHMTSPNDGRCRLSLRSHSRSRLI